MSDRGTAFTSHEFHGYCKEENIEHVLTTTGVPRGNGQVERINRTLIPIITKLSAPKPAEWFKYLSMAQQCINATPSRSTGTTPFDVLFGTRMRIKDDPEIWEMIETEWITTFQEDRDKLREHARTNILKIQQENAKNYNKKRKEAHRYKGDDLVAVKSTQIGPGMKCCAMTNILYEEWVMAKGRSRTPTSGDNLKPWISNISDVSSSEKSESDI